MAGLDAEVDVVLLVGHHARAGSFPGIMAHTVSYGAFQSVRVGGNDCGESEIFSIRAGELGVPVGLICGDQVVIDQLQKRTPWAEAVCVKRALSREAGDVIPPERTRPLIRDAARRAVERARAGELPPYTDEPAPYAIEVELREPIPDRDHGRAQRRHPGPRHGPGLSAHRVPRLRQPPGRHSLLRRPDTGKCQNAPARRP
jgi:D-amino peptidase